MNDIIRVARTLTHGTDAAELAEDLPFLQKVKAAFELLQFVVEGARANVRSSEGRAMVGELEEVLADVKHDASVNWVVERAVEATQLVGTVNIRVAR